MNGIDVAVDRGGSVATIRIQRPEKRNALDAEQWVALGDVLQELSGSRDLRVLVVTGTGDSFAAGGDLSRFLAEIVTPEDARAFRARLARVFDGLAEFPAPTIAKVNGPAIGGGLEMCVACDLRIASDEARFGMPAARFAMTMARPDLERLVDAVGVSAARWLSLTGKVVRGDEALRLGLVHAVTPAAELDAATERVVDGLLAADRSAVEWFRRSIRDIARGVPPREELIAQEITSLVGESFRERVSSFLERERARRAAGHA